MPESSRGPVSRRTVLAALAASAGAAMPALLRAQPAFPQQPVRVIVPFGPGGLADISMRIVAQKLSERLGQQVIVENRPGAGGVLAANATLAAPHDGYTLILFTNGTTIAKSLFKSGYDPEVDFVPVSSIAYFDLVLLVGKDSPLQDLGGLLAQGRKRRLNLGSINPGSTQHLSAELFKSVAAIEATSVPFKSSGDVFAALVRGDVDVGFESYAALKGPIDAGQVRVIAQTGPARTAWLPHVPTVREAGLPGYEVTGWNALYAPKGAPPAAIELLNAQVREIVSMPDVRTRFLSMGIDPRSSTPAEQAAVFGRDYRKWAKVIQQANIKIQ
jgi:tripartite-type tricarboxylate transporter receptor subunit TctC